MTGQRREHALDHVVVVMFENRSFDNLLGRLYQPGEVPAFEGVLGKELANPIPPWAPSGAERTAVAYGAAGNMNTPSPDPGEEYQHVNTQLFGLVDPPTNRGVRAAKMTAPFNLPADPGRTPTMDGFVADYISAFQSELGRPPTYDQYAQIMTGYTPEQMPVLSALARGFATFDHWFCEVPSQTFTNRSFLHAATASGFVVNTDPADAFPVHNRAETVFERLTAGGLDWRVYCDPPSHVSFTGIIHASRLHPYFKSHFCTTDQFLEDAERGELPAYSFIEPNLLYGHNDMHPALDAVFHGLALDPPSPLLGGEKMLARIYDAVRTSSSAGGSNALNTVLLVVFDEHGGTYDHVPPPAVAPPDPAAPAGQFGFGFDRSGLRVPAVAISAWVPERTVVTDEYRHTSVIRTLRERWPIGPALTARDAAARDIAPVLSLDTPRTPGEWPEVTAQPVPPFDRSMLPRQAPISKLQLGALVALTALGRKLDRSIPEVQLDAEIKGAEAIESIAQLFGHLFPRLRQTEAPATDPGPPGGGGTTV